MTHLRTYRRREDRLSSLPDELLIAVLSFLPTRIAARSSVLSRRFQYLWQQCPSLDLTFDRWQPQNFIKIANRTLLCRNHPLLRLCLDFQNFEDSEFIIQLLDKAKDLGVCHLKIEGGLLGSEFTPFFSRFLHSILFIPGLESLSLGTLFDFEYPSRVPLTQLKSLSLQICGFDPATLHRFFSDLCSLVELDVWVISVKTISISSKTIRKLKLKFNQGYVQLDSVMLCIPFLELLHLECSFTEQWPFRFQGEIPLLRKAVLILNGLEKKNCSGLPGLINSLSHVEELILHVKESRFEENSFPTLLEPGKDVSDFPNLKHLEATMCFHTHNFNVVVSVLCHSPALQSVKLVHKPHEMLFKSRRRKCWASKLPRNEDGNYRYIHLTNLHLGENSKQFRKLLNKKCASKS